MPRRSSSACSPPSRSRSSSSACRSPGPARRSTWKAAWRCSAKRSPRGRSTSRTRMQVLRTDTMPVRSDGDVVLARQTVRRWAVEAGFTLVDQTKMVTAASELARNTVIYGKGGTMRLELLQDGGRRALRLTFEDKGPGIPDVKLALQDGY